MKRFLLAVVFGLTILLGAVPAQVFANHQSNGWNFHSSNRDYIELTDPADVNKKYLFTKSRESDNQISYFGRLSLGNCPENRGFTIAVDKDSYNLFVSPSYGTMELIAATYGVGGDDTCELMDALQDDINDGDIRVGYLATASQGSSSGSGTGSGSGSGSSSQDGVSGQAGGDTNVTCESSQDNPLTWLLCPVFNGIADMTDFIFRNLIEPYLITTPVSTNPDDPTFKVWSTFRLYGNIVLVIMMLVIVFGQSIGGGLIDAYTAKKVLPRILATAILINLSIYIVAALVDVTNVIGDGIGRLILAPFELNDYLEFSLDVGQGFGVVLTGMLGLFLSGGAAAGFFGAVLAGGGGFAAVGMWILLAVIIPALIALVGVFATLVIRRGLILFLIIVSPIAFALYCLPNTEKYFKKWWELLAKALLVYPIIVVIFAIADILSVTILRANNIDGQNLANGLVLEVGDVVAAIIAFVLQFLPLVLIPFSFKFAGGALSSIYGSITNSSGKISEFTKNRRKSQEIRARNQMLLSRQRQYDVLKARGDRARGLRRLAYRQLAGRVGGNNMHEALSHMAAERFKEMEAIKDTGIDDELRALTVNKAWAMRQDAAALAAGRDGEHVRVRDGVRQFRTLGGRWVNESDVDVAHSRWGGDQAALQWALGYEMQKAATQEEQDYLYANYGRMNEDGSSFRMSDAQMGGLWTGAAFAKQNTDRQWKHHVWNSETGRLESAGINLMREIDERQGTYQMTAQSADTWTTMSQEIARARRVLTTGTAEGDMDLATAEEVMQRGARIARSIRSPGGRQQLEDGTVIEMPDNIGAGAAGRTKEEMENFANMFTWTQQVVDPATGNVVTQRLSDPLEYSREAGMQRRGTGSTLRSGTPPPGPAADRPERNQTP